MYKNLLNNFVKHRWIVLALTGILWFILVFSASGLKLDENIMKLLPEENDRISAYREIYEKFNPMNAVFIDIAIDSTAQYHDLLIKTADGIYDSLEISSFFNDIIYRWQIQDLQQAMEVLREHQSVLFTPQDSLEVQKRLNYNFISERIRQWKREMMETPSPFLAGQFIRDPLDFDSILQKKLAGSQTAGNNITVYKGRLFNKSLNHVLIIAQPKFKSTDTGNSRELIYFLDKLFFQQEQVTESKVEISYISAHRFSIENANRIQSDIQRTVSIALIAIIILSLLVYSRPVLMVFTLLPALFGSAFSLGIIRLFDPSISAIIIGSGAMLIGITVDYGIHFLYHIDQSSIENNSQFSTARRLLKPLSLSAGTTMIAFLALRFSNLPGYRQLSMFVILGIFGAVLFVLFILPLLAKQSSGIKRPVIDVQKIFPVLFAFIHRKRMIVFMVMGILTAAAIPGILRLEFDGDVQNLNAVSPAIQSDMGKINNEYGNLLSSTLLMITAQNMNSALTKNEEMIKKIGLHFSDQQIRITNPAINLLPSDSRQEKNRRRWQALFNDEMVGKLQSWFNKAEQQFGLKEDVFRVFIEDLTKSPGKITFNDYLGTLVEDILSNVIQIDSSAVYILSNVGITSDEQIVILSDFIDTMNMDVFLYDGKVFVNQIIRMILTELKNIGLLAVIFVLFFISITIRNIKTTLIIFVPLLISTFWTFSILGWFGIKINIINSIISVFIFGLVIDYCIFLVTGLGSVSGNLQSRFISSSGGAIVISALTTMIGLGALVFAGHPALHSLGVTAFVGIGCGMLIVFIIIPAMIIKKSKDFSN